jgi:hypothetical protein
MNQSTLDAYEKAQGVTIDKDGKHILGPGTAPRKDWDNSLGGPIGMAGLDSSYGLFGEPDLKTTDPYYLAMGARPMADQSSLPQFLQGGV